MTTDQQLANRSNPTPVNFTLPGEGEVWRDPNNYFGGIYYNQGGKLYNVSLGDTSLVPDKDVGSQLGGKYNTQNGVQNAAIQNLNSNYGINYDTGITQKGYNMADVSSVLGTGGSAAKGDLNTLKALLAAKAGPSTTKTVNGPEVAADVQKQLSDLAVYSANHPNVPGTTPAQSVNTGAAPLNTTTGTAGGAALTPAQAQAPQMVAAGTPAAPTTSGTTSAAGTALTTPAAIGYAGPSVVDYLHSVGQASDFGSRSKLAAANGIVNYSGTAAQNTQLLNTLRTQHPTNTPAGGSITTPTGGTTGAASSSPIANSGKYTGLDPVTKQVQMYQDTYKALGLNTIKDQWDTYNKQLADVTNELNDKISAVQNDPWMAQSVVDRTVQKLQTAYAVKIDTYTKLATLAETAYTKGTAQVDNIVSGANADIKAANDLAQKQIDAANALAKDNVVQSVGGREYLVNKSSGKIVADLGPTTHFTAASTTPKPTVAETQASGFQTINQILDTRNTTVGETYQDSNGYITSKGFKTLLDAAGGSGISRAEFLDRYSGQMFQGSGSAKLYGVTPAEATKYGFQ